MLGPVWPWPLLPFFFSLHCLEEPEKIAFCNVWPLNLWGLVRLNGVDIRKCGCMSSDCSLLCVVYDDLLPCEQYLQLTQ